MYFFNLSKTSKGQSLVEYALILASVALLIFILITAYGIEIQQLYNSIYEDLF